MKSYHGLRNQAKILKKAPSGAKYW